MKFTQKVFGTLSKTERSAGLHDGTWPSLPIAEWWRDWPWHDFVRTDAEPVRRQKVHLNDRAVDKYMKHNRQDFFKGQFARCYISLFLSALCKSNRFPKFFFQVQV